MLHENLYYASREVGRLYETEQCLHNYALTYALGLAAAPYFQSQQVPRYAEELTPLNERGIYVTPARGVEVRYSLSTFKYASNLYHVEMEKGSRNTPSFGRAKELAVESSFEFVVLSEQESSHYHAGFALVCGAAKPRLPGKRLRILSLALGFTPWLFRSILSMFPGISWSLTCFLYHQSASSKTHKWKENIMISQTACKSL